jgi:carbonic anhydrase
VEALQTHNDLPGHIAGLVQDMKPGIEPILSQPVGDLKQRAVVADVRFNVQRLQQAMPILADVVAKGHLRVVGAVYDLGTGKIALV